MLENGDLVFAHVKGHPKWPGRIIEHHIEAGKFTVFFYGTYEISLLKSENVWPYNAENKAKWGHLKVKRSEFARAIREIEETPDIALDAVPPPSLTPKPAKMAKKSASKTILHPVQKMSKNRKLYAQVKGTDEIIEIDIDKNRPKTFASKEDAHKWETHRVQEILKFKKLVEDGKFVPEEVVERLEKKGSDRSQSETEVLEKWKLLSKDRHEKIEWLNTEFKLAQAEENMRNCLDLDLPMPELSQCLDTLSSISTFKIAPLMLKKQPQIVKTMQKLCFYKGPEGLEGPQLNQAKKIRELAAANMLRFQACFEIPEHITFSTFFAREVKEFSAKVQNLPSGHLTYLTNEPNE